MNCKPGDLAVIIRDSYGPGIHLGKIVTVTALVEGPNQYGEMCFGWLTDPALFDEDDVRAVFMDGALRPIRDPGDDALDESKAWLPPVPLPAIDPSLIPEKESEHAQ